MVETAETTEESISAGTALALKVGLVRKMWLNLGINKQFFKRNKAL